jgi:hypothetical protein
LAAVCLKMYESHIHNNNNNNNLGCDERYACHFFWKKEMRGWTVASRYVHFSVQVILWNDQESSSFRSIVWKREWERKTLKIEKFHLVWAFGEATSAGRLFPPHTLCV